MRLAIVSAIQQEISAICNLGTSSKKEVLANREFLIKNIHGIECILTTTQVGKVAAALTISTLILHYKATHVVVIGTAGALHPDLAIGDIVIGDKLFQHDVDLRPFRPRFEIGILGKTSFESDEFLTKSAIEAANQFINQHIKTQTEKLNKFNINDPKITQGLIVSGDIFLSSSSYKDYRKTLCDTRPEILAVEMEGAAIAQVCHEFNIPFTVIRFISDKADHSAEINFTDFLPEIAGWYGKEIIENLIKLVFPSPSKEKETTSSLSGLTFTKAEPSVKSSQSLLFTQSKVASRTQSALQQWTQSIANQGTWVLKRDGQYLHIIFDSHQKETDITSLLTDLHTHLSQLPEWQKVVAYQQESNGLLIQLRSEVDAEIYEEPLRGILNSIAKLELSETCAIN